MRGALLRRKAGGGCPHVVCGLTSEVRRLTPGFTDPPKLPARTGAYSIPRIDVNPQSYRVLRAVLLRQRQAWPIKFISIIRKTGSELCVPDSWHSARGAIRNRDCFSDAASRVRVGTRLTKC